jgi:hypothetical protein
MSTPTPASLRGMTMSLKKMPASTWWRRTGCSVISLAISGSRHASSMRVPTRSSRYSGSDRPAWRMNHTGARSPRWPRYASTSSDDAVRVLSGCSAGSGTAADAGAEDEEEGVITGKIIASPACAPAPLGRDAGDGAGRAGT